MPAATTTVTLSATTLEVLPGPVSLREAFDSLDEHGMFTAVIAVPTEEMCDPDSNYDAFYDNLVNRLVVPCDAYAVTYRVRGVAEDGSTLYVQVSNSIVDLAAVEPDLFVENGISEDEVLRLCSSVRDA